MLLSLDLLPAWLSWANSFYLFLAGAVMLFWLRDQIGARRAAAFAATTVSIALSAEWIGVHTGLWFGTYAYGGGFPPVAFGVPVAIGAAWCLVLGIGAALSSGYRSPAARAATGSLVAVGADLLLDPVAVRQGYWLWDTSGTPSFYGVPWTNFVCWWVTGFAILLLAERLGLFTPPLQRASRKLPLLLLGTLWLLFTAVALRHGLWVPSLVSLVLCGALAGWDKYVTRMPDRKEKRP